MIGVIIRTEWRLFRRDRWRRALVGVTAVLCLVATWSGLAWQARHHGIVQVAKDREARYFTVVRGERLRLGPNPKKDSGTASADAGWISGWGSVAARDVPVLAALAPGRAEFVDPAPRITMYSRRGEITASNEELENPALQAIGRFDLAFAVVVLLPLVAIGLGHDAVARERDAGRWSLLASTGVSARTVALGAAVVRSGLGVAAPLLLSAVAFLLGGGEATWATLAWFGVALGYGATWTLVAAAFGARASSAGVALVRAAALWVALVVLAPAAAGAAVESLVPAMTRGQFRAALAREAEAAAADRLAVARRFAIEQPSLMPVVPADPFMAPGFYALDYVETDRRTAAVVDARTAALARRDTLLRAVAWGIPPLLVATALERLAGTDASAEASYDAAVLAYHAAARSAYVEPLLRARLLRIEEVQQRPVFQWSPEPPPRTVLLGPGVVLVVLAGLAVAAMPGRRSRERERVFIARGATAR